MINEQYVSSEVVRLLKEKGFKYAGFRYIDFEGEVIEQTIPTQQTVMRWLREVHHIHVCPEYKAFFQERPKKVYHHWCNKIVGIGRCFKHGIQDLDKLDSDYFYFRSCKTYHDTYENACEECIEFALRNLIEKGGKDEQD